jgi:hypothetical protein
MFNVNHEVIKVPRRPFRDKLTLFNTLYFAGSDERMATATYVEVLNDKGSLKLHWAKALKIVLEKPDGMAVDEKTDLLADSVQLEVETPFLVQVWSQTCMPKVNGGYEFFRDFKHISSREISGRYFREGAVSALREFAQHHKKLPIADIQLRKSIWYPGCAADLS